MRTCINTTHLPENRRDMFEGGRERSQYSVQICRRVEQIEQCMRMGSRNKRRESVEHRNISQPNEVRVSVGGRAECAMLQQVTTHEPAARFSLTFKGTPLDYVTTHHVLTKRVERKKVEI